MYMIVAIAEGSTKQEILENNIPDHKNVSSYIDQLMLKHGYKMREPMGYYTHKNKLYMNAFVKYYEEDGE